MWKTRLASATFLLAASSAVFAFPAQAAVLTSLCVCQVGSANCTEETIDWDAQPTQDQIETACDAKCPGGSGDVRFSVSDKNASTVAAARAGCPNFAAPPPTDPNVQNLNVGGREITFVKPTLSFDIPGLQFSDVLQKGNVLEVGFLADYISAAYQMLLGLSITIAIVMIMLGGIQYVLGAGTGEVKAAKQRITNAVTGLVLMLSVYVILFTVNPQLTLLPALRIEMPEEIPLEYEDDAVAGTLAVDFKAPAGSNVRGGGAAQVPSDLTASVEAAAKKLEAQGLGISIASSFRSIEKQIELIKLNCQNPPGSATCNPKPGKAQTCILKDMDPAKCPHTTGHALDIWATKPTSDGTYVQCVSQEACLGNKACFNDPCQKALITAMKAEGFCVLGSEAWHFEKPRMSANCN